MAALTGSNIRQESIQITAPTFGKWTVCEVVASQNDTVDITGHTTIDDSIVIRKSDGATVSHTRSGNRLTITGAASSVDMLIYVYEV